LALVRVPVPLLVSLIASYLIPAAGQQ